MKVFRISVISIFLVTVLTGIMCAGAMAFYVFVYLDQEIGIDLDKVSMNLTSIVYAKNPETNEYYEVERLYAKENRIWAESEEIPENLKNAFVAIEDERFMTHNGVDWKRTLGAAVNYIIPTGKSYGGSTITQQLIKNLTSEDDVRPDRKIKEILRAQNLEEKYEKDEILTMYLNTIHLGSGLNGVQTAANTYFDKDVSGLSLAECASIAGITKYPTKYNPFLNPEENKKRQLIILNKMLELEMITKEEYEEAKEEELVFNKEKATEEKESLQSYFVDAVMDDVINDLMKQKGYSKQIATQMIYNSGMKIYTTMDPNIQKTMDDFYKKPDSFQKLSGTTQPESAMVIMDPYSGEIKGLVGGRGDKTGNRTLNRAVDSYRQPGSTFKPVSVYAPAFEKGIINYGTPVVDEPVFVETQRPKNYYTGFKGPMTIETAVALSVNTVAQKILIDMTPQVAFDFLTQKLGFTSLVEKKVVGDKVQTDIIPSLALGGITKGVSVKELTASYAPFINKGVYYEPHTYTKVEDSAGNIILENTGNGKVAMSEETSFLMSKLLLNAVASGTGSPARLKNSMPTAGKTGTTDDDRDRWFVGYTPYYVGAVWYGYDMPKEVRGVSGNPALKAWKAIMDEVHKNLPKAGFPEQPSTLVTGKMCGVSGMMVGPLCPSIATGYFKKDNLPSVECDVHYSVDICKESGLLATEYCPIELREIKTGELVDGKIPEMETCPIHTEGWVPPLPPGWDVIDPEIPSNPDDPTNGGNPNHPPEIPIFPTNPFVPVE